MDNNYNNYNQSGQQYGYSQQPVQPQYGYNQQPVQPQYGYAQQQYNPYAMQQTEQPAKPLAIVGMVLGIISMVGCCYTGFIFGLPGLICSLISKKKGNTSGMATAGVVTSIIGLAMFAIMLIIMVLGIGASGGLEELIEEIEYGYY